MKKSFILFIHLVMMVISTFIFPSCSMEDELNLDNEAYVSDIKLEGTNATITVTLSGTLTRQPYVDEKSNLGVLLDGGSYTLVDKSFNRTSSGTIDFTFSVKDLKPRTEYGFVLLTDSIYLDYPHKNIGYGRFRSSIVITPSNNTFKTGVNYSLPMKAIDLGLSVLWGERDLGLPAGYTEPLSIPWIVEGSDFSTSVNSPTYYLESISGTQYDMATKYLGEGWRTPTVEEWKELIEHCKWELWTNYSESTGEIHRWWNRFYGNGEFAANYIDLYPFNAATTDYYGQYWTADRIKKSSWDVNTFYTTYKGWEFKSASGLYNECSLRPVKDK